MVLSWTIQHKQFKINKEFSKYNYAVLWPAKGRDRRGNGWQQASHDVTCPIFKPDGSSIEQSVCCLFAGSILFKGIINDEISYVTTYENAI